MNNFYNIFLFILFSLFFLFISCKNKEGIIEPPIEKVQGKIVYGLSNSKIFLIDFNIENQEPVLLFEPGIEPVVSPDGMKIVFTGISDISRTFDLFIMNINGSDVRNLTSTDYLGESFPNWSPDNSKIVFDSWNEAIYTINVDGTELKPVTDTSKNYLSLLASWSPDGNYIAYLNALRIEPGQGPLNNRLKLISLRDNSDIFLDSMLSASQIKWSPDGKKLIYEKREQEICIWDFNSNSSHTISINNIIFTYATWLPNGNILCNGIKSSENFFGVYVLSISDLNNPLQVLNGFYCDYPAPVIPSPDGNYIAVFARRANEDGLYLYISKADGSDLKKVWLLDESNETMIGSGFYCDWIE